MLWTVTNRLLIGERPAASNFFHDAPVDIETFAKVEFHGFDQDFGLEFLTGGDDVGQLHAGFNGKGTLGNDRSFIQPHGDKVGSDAGDLDAALVGLPVGLGSGEARQEGGMDVDDFVFVAPHEVGREDLHEPGQHDEIDLVFLQQFEGRLLGTVAVFPVQVGKRQLVRFGAGAEIGVIADNEGGFGGEAGGEEGVEAMGFLGDHEGEALALAGLGKAHLDLHAQAFGEGGEAGAQGEFRETHPGPGGLEGHAELAAGNLLFKRLNVGVLFEKKGSDAGDHAGFVPSDHGDGGE